MEFQYRPHGVCSQGITFELEDGIVRNVKFYGGCNGNTQGISLLSEGMSAEEIIRRLRGVRCGMRKTSCPDQLAMALEGALKEAKQ